MEQSNRRWIIRDKDGRIDGPYSTEKILYKIGRGEFTGDEFISTFPDGKWLAISQEPEFYDRLLEVLSGQADSSTPDTTYVPEFTKQQPPPPKPERAQSGVIREKKEEELTPTPSVVAQVEEPVSENAAKKKKKRRKRSQEDVIELVDIRPEAFRLMLKKAATPLLVAVAGLALAALLVKTVQPREDRIHLVAPQKGIAQVAPETLKPRVRQGLAHFLKDTLDGYVRAQNEFVFLVERDNKSAETMALLCLTYLQLWPYAYQDSADSKAVTTMMQMSSAVDPGGMHSATCRAVDLMVRSRFAEAKSLVEAILDARGSDAKPPIVFYYLKGELLLGTGDPTSAVGYLRSAQQLWPQWLLPFVVEGQALLKLEKHNEAAKVFSQVLKANPSHTVARIELGLLEYKHLNHRDVGERLLKQALESDDAPRTTLSRGYFGLAEMALGAGDQSLALKYAQKAFSINPSNASAKNLIVQLGGADKLKTTKVKAQQLIFEGDQFFREGDCHSAQAHYKAAFEEDPRNSVSAQKAAQCLWKLSFSTEAMDWLDRAIKADPKAIDAYVLLADYQAQRFNFLAATRILEQAKRINARSSDVYRGFAMVEYRRGNAKGAIAYGKEALKLYENDVETLILLGEASLALKDPKMAYNYASKAIEIDVNHRKAQTVYAESLAALQGMDVGVDYFLKLVNNYPLVSDYRLALGRMLLADERYSQAEEIFRQLIKLEDKPKHALIELAKTLRATGETREALELLLKAAVLDPADAEPLYIAGMIYLDVKKPQEASLQFNRVLTINKLYPLVYYQLGRAALMSNDPKGALAFTEQEKRANPNLADAYLLSAEAHSALQQYSMCASEYQRAIKLRPQNAAIYVRLAQCNRKAGNLDAAMAMLNVAATKESGLADIYKEQGAIYELKGDVNHAIEAYNQYFSLDPEAPDRAQIEDRISALQRGQRP